MELKVENQGTIKASHLDLHFEIKDRVLISKLYDKREAFKFSVVRMPFKCSNMPYKIFILLSVLMFFSFFVPHLVTCFSLKVLENLLFE